MENIKLKLLKIGEFWNEYIWKTQLLQKKIRYNSTSDTNYYGDILRYFAESADLVKLPEKDDTDYASNLLFATGLLQTLFVHQDLTDEFLYIFNLNDSSPLEKKPNRDLRNELIDYPIRWDEKNRLTLAVIAGSKLSGTELELIKYERSDSYRGKVIRHDFKTIIEDHVKYLDKYLSQIWKRATAILKDYRKQLSDFENTIEHNVSLDRIIELCEQKFERIFTFRKIYAKEYLLDCEYRSSEHPRYNNVANLFTSELCHALADTKANIDRLLESDLLSEAAANDEFYLSFSIAEKTSSRAGKNNYRAELNKLIDREFVPDFRYYKDLFKGNKEILSELAHMESNDESELEYYAALEYIKELVKS